MTEEPQERALTREEVGEMLAQRWFDEAAEFDARETAAAAFDEELFAGVDLAFGLVNASRAFEYHLSRVAKGFAMTALQARFAWILATHPFGMPLSSLRIELGVSSAGASQMMRRMIDRGHVETTGPGYDPRTIVVTLTEAGLQAWSRIKTRLAETSDEIHDALAPLTSDEIVAQLRALRKLDDRDAWFEMLRHPLRFLS